jgi:hypothetical protein
LLAISFALSGCAANWPLVRRDQTVGHVGCEKNEIQVSNVHDNTWNVSCRGHEYTCAATMVSNYGTQEIACTELLSQAASKP